MWNWYSVLWLYRAPNTTKTGSIEVHAFNYQDLSNLVWLTDKIVLAKFSRIGICQTLNGFILAGKFFLLFKSDKCRILVHVLPNVLAYVDCIVYTISSYCWWFKWNDCLSLNVWNVNISSIINLNISSHSSKWLDSLHSSKCHSLYMYKQKIQLNFNNMQETFSVNWMAWLLYVTQTEIIQNRK